MKNNIKFNAIPESAGTSCAVTNGNVNITAIDTANHKTDYLEISFFIIYPVHSCVLFHSAQKNSASWQYHVLL